MTIEAWAIIAVGAVLAYIKVIAASENEKRLDRISHQIQRLADELRERN